jgi:inhibitor of cysteine peptidase
MKAKVLLAFTAILGIGAIYGCAAAPVNDSNADQPGQPGGMPRNDHFVVLYDDFLAQKHITQAIELNVGAPVTVTLTSNPTTGFKWAENATIADAEILGQTTHEYVASQADTKVGASGQEIWSFKALKIGTTQVKMEYSRPWEGGEKAEWTYTLNVTVK